jgi:hypothetical protein
VTTTDAERHFTIDELEGRLPAVHGAPVEVGRVELVIRRPAEGRRELLDEATLDLERGVVGDRWSLAGEKERWPLAGDQLYVELDLSEENLPPGTRLAAGTAVLEVSDEPHTGCKKFVARFGMDAMLLVNSPEGRALRLRGMNTRIVEPGVVRPGDEIRKLA